MTVMQPLNSNHEAEQPLLLNFQKVLEHNEDIIAAIVENMQLGRMEDCINHYMILQSNLVSLGCELDNYPAGESDLYEEAYSFPDEIMRKDVLDDLLPHKSRILPKPPLAPPCWKCASQNLSAETCRVDLDHIDPSSKFSQAELEEFYHATEVLTSRYKQHSIESLSKHGARQKKSYKFWSDADRHSLLLAINVLKTRDAGRIAELLGDRNEKAVYLYLSKVDESVFQDAVNGRLPPPPAGYEPPAALVAYLRNLSNNPNNAQPNAKTNDASTVSAGASNSSLGLPPLGVQTDALPSESQSCLAPKRGSNDWRTLVEMATANSFQQRSSGSSALQPPRAATKVPDLDELHALIKSTSARRSGLPNGSLGFDPRNPHPTPLPGGGFQGFYHPYYNPGLADAYAQAHYAHIMSLAGRGMPPPPLHLAQHAPLMPSLFGFGFMGVPLPAPPPPFLNNPLKPAGLTAASNQPADAIASSSKPGANASSSSTAGVTSIGNSTDASTASRTAANPPKQPPPFARAGLLRLRQQQQQELELKRIHDAYTNPYLEAMDPFKKQEYLQQQWEMHRVYRGMNRKKGSGVSRVLASQAAREAAAAAAAERLGYSGGIVIAAPTAATQRPISQAGANSSGNSHASATRAAAAAVSTAVAPTDTTGQALQTAQAPHILSSLNPPSTSASASSSSISSGAPVESSRSNSRSNDGNDGYSGAAPSTAGMRNIHIPDLPAGAHLAVPAYGEVVIGDDEKVSEDELTDSDDDNEE